MEIFRTLIRKFEYQQIRKLGKENHIEIIVIIQIIVIVLSLIRKSEYFLSLAQVVQTISAEDDR
jgi:hypothetical protein